jgi:hypothetical protein
MTTPTFRPAVALLAGFALALAGCGKPPASPSADGDKKGGGQTPPPAAAGPVSPTDPRLAAAQSFATALVAGKAEPAALTPAFAKALGVPVVAKAWLESAGNKLAGLGPIAPPDGTSVGDGSAVFVGPAGTGRYLARVASGSKIDWFGIGTAKTNDPPKAATADDALQEFAVLAFLDAATGTAITGEDRAPLLAAVMSEGYRQKAATPFQADKDRGEDYNRAKLAALFDGFAAGATEFTRARTGAARFKAEITKGGSKRAFTLALVRTPAGAWVVDEFLPE